MAEKQKTIAQEVSLEGVGLHTGHPVKICFKPAQPNTGVYFVRTDLPNRPRIKADFSNLVTKNEIHRRTIISRDGVSVHTVEHLMSVLCGIEVDNLTIEINADEVPGLDGSGLDFLNAIKKAKLKQQDAMRPCLEIREPLWVEREDSFIYAVPSRDFKISYTLNYPNPYLRSQFFSIVVAPDTFEAQIAPSRTFCLESEAEQLRKEGLGKGANFKNTLVVAPGGVIENKTRFDDEFVRHKILDVIGDMYLLGLPLRGHIIAVKSGHSLNHQLLAKIVEQQKKYGDSSSPPAYNFEGVKGIDINGIMKILPHRFPFLFVDKVFQLEDGRMAGIKNVTINDNFFQGHFPSKPVMPGVLLVEAMAQMGGLVILAHPEHRGQIAFFMAADKVKFRKVVVPGDQLLLEAEIIRAKSKTVHIRTTAKVESEIVAEAEILFSFTDAAYLKN